MHLIWNGTVASYGLEREIRRNYLENVETTLGNCNSLQSHKLLVNGICMAWSGMDLLLGVCFATFSSEEKR